MRSRHACPLHPTLLAADDASYEQGLSEDDAEAAEGEGSEGAGPSAPQAGAASGGSAWTLLAMSHAQHTVC